MTHYCIANNCKEMISEGINWCKQHGTTELQRRLRNDDSIKYSTRPLM